MAQVKKEAVHDAILSAAERQFVAHGYSGTTLSAIAKRADVTTSNIYNYFPSKLAVLYALYEPWLNQRLDALAADAAQIGDPRKRLCRILMGVLHDIPSADNCFANNVLQALSTLPMDEPYSRDLLFRSERRVAQLIREAIQGSRHGAIDEGLLAHLLFMAFDGFALHYRIASPSKKRVEAIAKLLTDLVLGDAAGTGRADGRPRKPLRAAGAGKKP